MKHLHMYVYVGYSRSQGGTRTAVVVESNLEYAIPYWRARKLVNDQINWEFR